MNAKAIKRHLCLTHHNHHQHHCRRHLNFSIFSRNYLGISLITKGMLWHSYCEIETHTLSKTTIVWVLISSSYFPFWASFHPRILKLFSRVQLRSNLFNNLNPFIVALLCDHFNLSSTQSSGKLSILS